MNTKILATIGVIIVVIIGVILFTGNQVESPTTSNNDATTTANTSSTPAEAGLATALSDGTYAINSDESAVRWTARKTLVPGYEDTGVVPIASGTVAVTDGQISASDITFAVAEISADQVSNENAGPSRLTQHLRSEDFFAVEQYPNGRLTLTGVAPIASTTEETDYEVTADLTLKGQTNEITFPAEVGMQDDQLIVRANTQIDRSRWNIRYGSPSFFNDLGDNVIGDMVDIAVDITADTDTGTAATTTNPTATTSTN